MFHDIEIGTVVVKHRDALRIVGRFEPFPAFEQNRELFDELLELEKQVDASIDDKSEDFYKIHSDYVAKLQSLTKNIRVQMLAEEVVEFNLNQDGSVEIFLGSNEIDLS